MKKPNKTRSVKRLVAADNDGCSGFSVGGQLPVAGDGPYRYHETDHSSLARALAGTHERKKVKRAIGGNEKVSDRET